MTCAYPSCSTQHHRCVLCTTRGTAPHTVDDRKRGRANRHVRGAERGRRRETTVLILHTIKLSSLCLGVHAIMPPAVARLQSRASPLLPPRSNVEYLMSCCLMRPLYTSNHHLLQIAFSHGVVYHSLQSKREPSRCFLFERGGQPCRQ